MKVKYLGPAQSYSWPNDKGDVAGTLHPGEEGTVPDEVLAGSMAQKGVRHQFVKSSDGKPLEIRDLKKDAQRIAQQQRAAAEAAQATP